MVMQLEKLIRSGHQLACLGQFLNLLCNLTIPYFDLSTLSRSFSSSISGPVFKTMVKKTSL